MSQLTLLPATKQLRLLQNRAVSAEELTRAHLREIDRLNPVLRAYVDVDATGAIAAARHADLRRTQLDPANPPPALLGLPISIKSSISVAGLLCETGSEIHRGHRPKQDAIAVQKLRAAGAVILGTTNCPELLMAYETDNILYGRTANPWSIEHQAGGSSGGEAAAIAAGMSAAGLGSDSGGSVRVPAHFTGICSLKPTAGRISAEGHTLPNVGPFETLGALGPMARTIPDISLLFKVLASGVRPAPALTTLLDKPIAVLDEDGHFPVTAETLEAVRASAEALEQRGFQIVPFSSQLLEQARMLWRTFFIRCGRIFLDPAIASRSGFSPTFQYFLAAAAAEPPLHAPELLSAWAESQQVRDALSAELSAFSALLAPVSSIPAFRHGERTWLIGDRTVEYFDAMRYTQWFNVLGGPAAVVPVGRSPENLPIGVQIASFPGSDETVLAIAALIEEQFGYRPPPLALGG
jgi:Asp-tRNA(Asn)/Glu-tRNA(Gln) amidotransferase A subunit family amidase